MGGCLWCVSVSEEGGTQVDPVLENGSDHVTRGSNHEPFRPIQFQNFIYRIHAPICCQLFLRVGCIT
jgi:hypothetical protein